MNYPTPTIDDLIFRIEQSEVHARTSSERLARAEQRQRSMGFLMLATVVAGAFLVTRTPAISQTSAQLQAEITALQSTLKYVTTAGTTMTISGANLVINNGAGTTATANGLGNVVIGYNELRNDTPNTDIRTGSHNLILGSQNSFSSWSGIVAGSDNTITGTFACVEGGFGNVASGAYANIGGGYQNVASANSTYVGGGGQNTASGPGASITGRNSNLASGGSAAISGGYANIASGSSTYVGGGENNTASGSASSVTGGYGNQALAASSAIAGGASNTANGTTSIVLGGNGNTSTDSYAVVPLDGVTTIIANLTTTVNGNNSTITDLQNAIASIDNSISSLNSQMHDTGVTLGVVFNQTKYISSGTDMNGFPATFISGCNVWVQDGSGSTNDGGGALRGLGNLIVGYNETSNFTNTRSGSHNLIVGTQNNYSSYGGFIAGTSNGISAPFAMITGGFFNLATASSSSVSGGYSNSAYGNCSSVSGGSANYASGQYSSVTGGFSNLASNYYSSVSGGFNNVASGVDTVVSGGNSLTQSNVYGWSGGSYHTP